MKNSMPMVKNSRADPLSKLFLSGTVLPESLQGNLKHLTRQGCKLLVNRGSIALLMGDLGSGVRSRFIGGMIISGTPQ